MASRSAQTLSAIFTHMRLLYTRPSGAIMLVILDAALWLQRPDIVDFRNRVQDIPPHFIYDVYDFVIVGGGSAGSVMAARLSEVCSWSILLLEAGPDETYISDLPMLYPTLQRSVLDWKYQTMPGNYCLAYKEGKCNWPRGKVLGGSSVLNAMMWVRGNKKDYDNWEKAGNLGWSWHDVLPYFKKLENMKDPEFTNLPYHGYKGPMQVEKFANYTHLRDIYMAAMEEMKLLNKYGEVNGPSQEGFAILHGNLKNGLRCSTAKAYLRPAARRKNLHISLNSFVEKILINKEDKRAYGVIFKKNDQKHFVVASKEVILSAGAINSPHLLKLSGIGPAAELKKHDIEVIHNAPGVGENMQDHVSAGGGTYLVTNPKTNLTLSTVLANLFSIATLEEIVYRDKGILKAMPACEVMGFINSKYQNPKENWPDIQIFFTSYSDVSDGGVFSEKASGISDAYYAHNFEKYIYKDAFMVLPLLMRPRSRGRLLLKNKNPYEKIIIYPNYFADPHDLDVIIEGLKFGLKVAQTEIMKALNATLIDYASGLSECSSSNGYTDKFFKCLAQHYSQTIYHPSCTCKMGPRSDPMAVVDAALLVHGIRGLRVVDTSIMPHITTGNTNAPTIMIAEKAADMVKFRYMNSLDKNVLANCETLFDSYQDYLPKKNNL